MNLIVGFVIVMCLVVNEARDPDIVTDIGWHVLLVGLISLLVPGLALVQTIPLVRQLRRNVLDDEAQRAKLQQIATYHGIGWLAISMVTVGWLHWPDVVHGVCDASNIPLLSELLMLTPVLGSLLLSWAIFFDVQQALESDSEFPARRPGDVVQNFWSKVSLSDRFRFVLIRFRSCVLIVLVPLLAAALVNHLMQATDDLPTGRRVLLWTACGGAFLAAFPQLLSRMWRCQPINDPALREQAFQLSRRMKTGVLDVRIWDTGNRIVNAMVTGMIPGTRMILLSDRLVQEFTESEILAVVRHEAGHIRLRHLPIRLLFMLLPLLILTFDQIGNAGLTEFAYDTIRSYHLSEGDVALLGVLAYFSYVMPTLAWLSRQLEYEADWFAVHTQPRAPLNSAAVGAADLGDPFDSMSLAIARLAAHCPHQLNHGSLLYPSLQQRLKRTRRTAQKSTGPEEVWRRVRLRGWLVNGAMGLLVAATIAQMLR